MIHSWLSPWVWTERADCKVINGFLTVQRVEIPWLFKGQLLANFQIMMLKELETNLNDT